MNLDKYSLYSVVSVTEEQNVEDLQKVLNVCYELKDIKTLRKARKFVKEKFNIAAPISNYPIGNNSYLSIFENDRSYSINIVFENENQTYTFEK